jgi:hypothetical protein
MTIHVLIEDEHSRKSIPNVNFVSLISIANEYVRISLTTDDGGAEFQLTDKCTIYVNKSNEPTTKKSE